MTSALLAFTTLLFFLRLRTGLGFGTVSAVQFPWLVIVPGASFFYPWTLITAAFCESSTLEFLVSVISLPLAARYLERQWGAVELIKFALVIVTVSNVIAWGVQLLLFGIFRKEALIWGIQYHGLQALQTAFLVAFTQLIPEHQVQVLSGALKLRVKDLPMLYVTVSNVMCLIGYNSPWILIQFGWLVSWAYLRFFKLNESGYRGDRSEAFAFVNWFPPFAHKPVQFISTTLFNIFVKVGIVQPWTGGDYADLESASLNGQPQQQGSARAEAERRRAMALKALDQRLSANKSSVGRSNSRSSGLQGAAAKESASSSTGADAAASGSASAAQTLPTVVFEAPPEDLPGEKEKESK